jgi:membrane-associated phospholipid phosphatase
MVQGERLAQVLKKGRHAGLEAVQFSGAGATSFWAVDKFIFVYMALTACILAACWRAVPSAAVLAAWHLAGPAAVYFQVKRPNPTSWAFRHWYPLLYVSVSYKEMAQLIRAVRSTDADQWLANLDFRLWGAHPTVWLERINTPLLTEFLQIVYTLFIPAVLFTAVLLWKRRQYREFQYYSFLIASGFLFSYVGYLLVPARGPRFLLTHLQHVPLQGLWLFKEMQGALDQLESAHYDCFPSGHTELTILAWWGSQMVSKRLFRVYLAYTPLIIFATVYLRYHYTIDVAAGAILACSLIAATPVLYKWLSKGV